MQIGMLFAIEVRVDRIAAQYEQEE